MRNCLPVYRDQLQQFIIHLHTLYNVHPTFVLCKNTSKSIRIVGEPVPQEKQLFALAEPEPECITVQVPEPDLDPDPT
jgi:hypothetical protein